VSPSQSTPSQSVPDSSTANREHLMRTYSPPDFFFVEGHGSMLFDQEGRDYVDLFGGIAVVALGHAHPEVSKAISLQAEKLMHISNVFQHPLAEEVASRLDSLLRSGVDGDCEEGRIFFANSGAEANECALKIVRKMSSPEKRVVICALGSFHGRTFETLAATGQMEKHAPFEPLPEGFRHVPYDDPEAIRSELAKGDVAGVMLEPIQGEGGVIVPSDSYLTEVRNACDEAGALLVLDEVQTGIGRTGQWFGFHHEGVRPDVVTMAKALGNGVPVGACWATGAAKDALGPGDHGSTFGGQPLALSAVKATLEVIERENLTERAAILGEQLKARLMELPGVEQVRGRGMLLAAVLSDPKAADAAKRALENGVVVNAVRPDALRLAPALNISEGELEKGLDRLAQALSAVFPDRSPKEVSK